MKVAFTSGMLQQRFDTQPVWRRIQAEDPDHLLLLGNAIHLDVDADVRRMSAGEFAEHAHGLYRAQLAVPEFDALLRHMAAKGGRRVFAVWDDHDFLWRGATGADLDRQPEHRDKRQPSRVLAWLFRRALVDVGSFPTRLGDVDPSVLADDAPLHESLPLRDDLWLHLTDGRSHRTDTWLLPQGQRALLGAAQLDALATAVDTAAPGAVHLVASAPAGVTWPHFQRDWSALKAVAARQRLLMLSGELLCNAFASHDDLRGLPLHEATASGAAVRDAIVYGAELQNFAIAEVDAAEVRVRSFDGDGEAGLRRIERERWRAAAGR